MGLVNSSFILIGRLGMPLLIKCNSFFLVNVAQFALAAFELTGIETRLFIPIHWFYFSSVLSHQMRLDLIAVLGLKDLQKSSWVSK